MAHPFDIYSYTALASGYPANDLIRGFQSWRGFCGFLAKAATGLKVLWMCLLAVNFEHCLKNELSIANHLTKKPRYLGKLLKVTHHTLNGFASCSDLMRHYQLRFAASIARLSILFAVYFHGTSFAAFFI